MVHPLLFLVCLLKVKPSRTQVPEVPVASENAAVSESRLRGAGNFNEIPAARIPRQLVLTSKEASPDTLPAPVKANLGRTLELETGAGLTMRWLDDHACLAYMEEHFGYIFKERLKNEPRGSFRGDICRAAVLYREGGFYVDLDVQMRVPLTTLVDDNTTFMTAFTADGAILNAIIATEPHNSIMAETLRELRRWYDGETSHYASPDEETSTEWMGPMTMYRGLRRVMKLHCPHMPYSDVRMQHRWTCGAQQLVTYNERELDCSEPVESGECPPSRANSTFAGANFGLFVGGPWHGPRKLVAWPRFEACKDWGCDGGGWSETAVQSNAPQKNKDL
mmetsp:Transcript_72999/g.144684  ORF Transcript_72999/g.144684 Transcript_72999/m.144684 type:complete len:335 (+) Transcript_72999:41-1045(+)